MFYKTVIKDHIRVPPKLFELPTKDAVLQMVRERYEGFISKELGIVVGILGVNEINEGIIIPGDGAPYYETQFEMLVYRPELQEVALGKVKDVADFGAFLTIGPIDGMIHISQTMDDFVSFAKDKVLVGKESKRSLKVNDLCRARIIASSFKDVTNPKIGLTMRQKGLGRMDWVEEDLNKKEDKKGNKKGDKK
ncbi:MAG: DNA-directed RNA polymerase [archaeon]